MHNLFWLKIDIEVIESFKTSSYTLHIFLAAAVPETIWEGRNIGDCPWLSKSFLFSVGNGSDSNGGSTQSYLGL